MNITHFTAIVVTTLFIVMRPVSARAAGDEECSAVMAWGKLQMYERGSSGQLMNRSFDPEKQTWSSWESLGEERITSSPSALMTNDGTRVAVFFRGTDGKLYHIFRDQEAPWSRVIGLGSQEMVTAPTAIIVAEVLTVFARNTSGKPMKIYYDKEKTSWTDWIALE